MTRRPSAEVAQLLRALDQAYSKVSWHGTNLRGSIRGMTPERAARRPSDGRHNIWELVVHCAYWKYAVWRKMTGAARGSFPLEGSNFFERPVESTNAAWRADVALLERMHRNLRSAVAALPARRLNQRVPGSKFTYADFVAGITAHDLYHAGQIQLLKKDRELTSQKIKSLTPRRTRGTRGLWGKSFCASCLDRRDLSPIAYVLDVLYVVEGF